jgi:putative pyruvate formate lyase activating enzyme
VARVTSSEIYQRARVARSLSAPCRLCPRRCGVDRIKGERGYCGAGNRPAVAGTLSHFGEEPPLVGHGGAGTIFFSRCNLRCVYCQNHQISQGSIGSAVSPDTLGQEILALQEKGCSTVEPVSPSHQLPALLEALALAVDGGLTLPIVYNTNAYESRETLDLLDGIVDVYLPDLKYASEANASRYSDSEDYVTTARAAIVQMHSQVGNLVVDLEGRAVKGLIVRHLVLPENVSGPFETLTWLGENLPLTVTLSLMAQYSPLHRSQDFPPLNRPVSLQEYEEVIDYAWEMGFENVFVQDLNAHESGIPDFNRPDPFIWE